MQNKNTLFKPKESYKDNGKLQRFLQQKPKAKLPKDYPTKPQ